MNWIDRVTDSRKLRLRILQLEEELGIEREYNKMLGEMLSNRLALVVDLRNQLDAYEKGGVDGIAE